MLYRANPLYGVHIKPGVNVKTIRPEISHALTVARGVFTALGKPITVTSWWRDNLASLHGHDLAVDLRANHLNSEEQQQILRGLQLALGPAYQVILHGEGDNIHFHIEYDPQRTGTLSFREEVTI